MINESIARRAARNAEEAKTDHLVIGTEPKKEYAPQQSEHRPVSSDSNKRLARSALDDLKESFK